MRTRSPHLSLSLLVLAGACSDGGQPAGPIVSNDTGGPRPDGGTMADASPLDAAAPDAESTDTGTSCGAAVDGTPTVVATDRGAVRGAALDGGRTLVFRGIPYAAPPVGPLRWAPPESAACFDDIFDASAFGPRCPQADDNGNPVGDENCLQLNVWTPADAPEQRKLPVLFFIHGGGNAQGSAVEVVAQRLLYDGQPLSEEHQVVVVTINYRLGALGYLVHPDLDGDLPSGNYGILDQIKALEWVRANIVHFGGDPERVMIFGESAGARNTCMLIASPLAAGLFSAALMQSGGCVARSEDQVLTDSATQIERSGCTGAAGGPIACLRGKSADQLIADNPPVVVVSGRNANPGPYMDGRVIPGQPFERIESGQHNAVPLIIGSNADETSRAVPTIASQQAYADLIRTQFGIVADQILNLYPASDFASPQEAYVAVTTDAQYTCNTRANARSAARGQAEPVYRYFWRQGLDAAPRLSAFGAFHAVELFFVFDNLRLAGYRPTAGETALARTAGTYWTTFAAEGDPNSPDLTVWPQYEPLADEAMVFDAVGVSVQAQIRGSKCDFWDQLLGR